MYPFQVVTPRRCAAREPAGREPARSAYKVLNLKVPSTNLCSCVATTKIRMYFTSCSKSAIIQRNESTWLNNNVPAFESGNPTKQRTQSCSEVHPPPCCKDLQASTRIQIPTHRLNQIFRLNFSYHLERAGLVGPSGSFSIRRVRS